jgi:hypothetical protein
LTSDAAEQEGCAFCALIARQIAFYFPFAFPSNLDFGAISHLLNSVTQAAAILNDISAFMVGGALFELHCLIAYDAANEIDQRASIVVARCAHFPFAFG